MKKLLVFLWLGLLPLVANGAWGAGREASQAAPDELASPMAAIVSPNGARLYVVQNRTVQIIDGKAVVSFVLPANAANLQISTHNQAIARWSTTPVLLDEDSPLAGRRALVEKERVSLSSRLMTVNSRLALWQAPPKSGSAQEMAQLQAAMQEEMPKLAHEQAQLEQRLKLVKEELSRMPQTSGLGERVRVVLAGPARDGSEVTLYYSYNHDSCGWEAMYDFNARPDEGSGDRIDVVMLAEVWQFTGIDWKDTEITLATQGFGPREPAPLPEWIVDSAQQKPQPRGATLGLKAAAPMALEASAVNVAPVANTDTIYATWQLPQKGLMQGRSRMEISKTVWNAPLQWLARPGRDDSQVWLLARYELPPEQAWPAGLAEYNVNGQNVGSGQFSPRNGEATLYFGADPRVSVITTTDSRKRGESGFINTSKTWTWAWTYTVYNGHNKAIKVKVERPTPVIVDQDVTVTYKNDPAAQEDPKEHLLYWLVDVPAHGKTAIEHSITLSSPTKLPLLPDVP